MERIPGVTELIRRYNQEIEGLSRKQREEKFPMPEGKPTVKVTGAELAKNPELVELLRAGTILKVDENLNAKITVVKGAIVHILDASESESKDQDFDEQQNILTIKLFSI